MKKSTTRVTVVIIILILGLVAYYTYLVNRSRSRQDDDRLSQVEIVLGRSLELDYPSTPREVLRYHNDVVRCIYSEGVTEEEVEALAQQLRRLFDEELLDHNAWSDHLKRLKAEVRIFNEAGRVISSSTTASAMDVAYYEEGSSSFARIQGSFNVREGRSGRMVRQVYLMRKNEEGRWKIYGWDLLENLNFNESSSEEDVN